jgi:hypothetical protein
MSHGNPHDARDGVARRADGGTEIDAILDELQHAGEFDDRAAQSIRELIENQRELLEQQQERIDSLEDQKEFLRDQSVFTVAVERVLLEYGLSTERVEEIVSAIEDVDAHLKEGDEDV